MSDEDYHAAVLTNKILGGGSVGRLEQQIREVKSFATQDQLGDSNNGTTESTINKPSVTDSTYEITLKSKTKLVSEEELPR